MKQRETLIRKIIPVELFDMAGLEHWLSDMAAQGLHLVKLNHDTARFRRGEPVPGVRFGLEITGVSDIDRERNAAYQEAVRSLRSVVLCFKVQIMPWERLVWLLLPLLCGSKCFLSVLLKVWESLWRLIADKITEQVSRNVSGKGSKPVG